MQDMAATLEKSLERISSFYQDKKTYKWMKKECIFTLQSIKKGKAKNVTESKYDMSKNIGLHDKITILNLGVGIMLKFTLNLGLACPVMHKSLFKQADADGILDDLEADMKGKIGDKMQE